MHKPALLGCAVFLTGVLFAQQPSPMAKAGESGKNYRSPDGNALSKNSSDEDLTRALNESFSNDPEFGGVQIFVKHHKATLSGTVDTKEAKNRAEKIAGDTEGIRYVHNRLKLAGAHPRNSSTMSAAH